MNVLPFMLVLLLALSLPPPSRPTIVRPRCISPPCDYTALDVDGALHDSISYDSASGARSLRLRRAVPLHDDEHVRSLAGLLGELAPVAAAASGLLASVAGLGFAAGNPYAYYPNPWYGGYGGGYGGYAPGYPYSPYRPFPYIR